MLKNFINLKKKSKVLLVLSTILAVVTTLVLAIPVFAIVNPVSTALYSNRVFQNIFESGDQLYITKYSANYTVATTPVELASDTFLCTIYDTDNTTGLYQTPLQFYGNAVIGVYLTPAQALVWGSTYYMSIRGNPSYFPVYVDGVNRSTANLTALDYFTGTEVESRAMLGNYILHVAALLEVERGIDFIGVDGKITPLGEVFFSSAIPGIVIACPTIFQTTLANPEVPTTSRTVTLVGSPVGLFVGGEFVSGNISSANGTYIAGSQTIDGIQVLHTTVNMFQVGDNVTGAGSAASIIVENIYIGKAEAAAASRTGDRLLTALTNLGATFGISGMAMGGLTLVMLYLLVSGTVLASTGSPAGAMLVALPVIFFGNYLGILAFSIVWLLVIIVVALFAITFFMARLA